MFKESLKESHKKDDKPSTVDSSQPTDFESHHLSYSFYHVRHCPDIQYENYYIDIRDTDEELGGQYAKILEDAARLINIVGLFNKVRAESLMADLEDCNRKFYEEEKVLKIERWKDVLKNAVIMRKNGSVCVKYQYFENSLPKSVKQRMIDDVSKVLKGASDICEICSKYNQLDSNERKMDLQKFKEEHSRSLFSYEWQNFVEEAIPWNID